MIEVGIHQAKTHLSDLVRRVESGEEVIIRRGSKPVARLVAVEVVPARRLGLDAGAFTVPDDFDAPLPDEAIADFEAG